MTDDRQTHRFAEARARHHAATQLLRDAQRELDAAAAELVTAGAALSERVRFTQACPVAPAAGTQGPTTSDVGRQARAARFRDVPRRSSTPTTTRGGTAA
jgi:hypothetical protein